MRGSDVRGSDVRGSDVRGNDVRGGVNGMLTHSPEHGEYKDPHNGRKGSNA